MKNYELSVVFHPDLEMNLEPAIAKVKNLIAENDGKIVKEENDGKKHTCYPLKGQDFGVYYFFLVELPPQAPAKIERVLNITDEVIRHLLVAEDERKLKYEAKQAARKPHGEDAEDGEEK